MVTISASSAAMSWDATYDDVAHTLVINGTGPGRCTIVVEQSNGKRAAAEFVQATGPLSTPIPVPDDIVPTLAVAPVLVTVPSGGTGTRTFSAITLKPYAPSKPGGQGTFALINAECNAG